MILFRPQLLALLVGASLSFACSSKTTSTSASACKPPLAIGPTSVTVAPLAQVVLTASGGRGAYVFDIPSNQSGARITSGTYVAGARTGVTDTVRVTAAGCRGEATAQIAIPDVLDVQPSHAELPPGTSFTFVVTRGSGSFAFQLTGNASGATIDASGLYTAGQAEGTDVVRVSDTVTGSFKDVTLAVSKSAKIVAQPEHLALPVGATTVLYASGGSGQVSATADGVVSSFDNGLLKAVAPGSVILKLTDVFTHQTTTMTLDVSAPYEAPTLRGGDKDTFRAIFMPPIVAQDLDADGKSDIVVGYADTSLNAALSGAVYVYKGTSAPGDRFEPVLVSSGATARERFGSALALGDFDGDGGVDLAVGSSNADTAFTDGGAVQIFSGVHGAPDLFAHTASLTITGLAPQDTSGSALAACDFNGDHIVDLAIGAPAGESSSTNPATRNQGAIRVVMGGAHGLDTSSSQFIYGQLPNASHVLTPVTDLGLGAVLAAADIDKDGRCELVASAPGYVPAGSTVAAGAIIVYRFDTGGVAQPAMFIRAIGTSAVELGRSIALRDIDGDGTVEILTGERSTANGTALIFEAQLTGADVTTDAAAASYQGQAAGDLCGASVEAANMDGDAQLDLVVGCIGIDSGVTDIGGVRVYTGHQGSMPADTSYTILGTGVQAHFGSVVAPVGDANDDGYDDLVVHVRDGDTEGLNFGSMSLVSSNVGQSVIDMALPGKSSLQQNGASVAFIGDLTGDGVDEIAVGVPLANVDLGVHDVDGLDAGRAIVYDGTQLTPLVLLEKHALHSTNDKLGTKVARMGDFDGDGYPDVAVLAASDQRPAAFPSGFSADAVCPGATGAVYIYGGAPASSVDTIPHFVIFGPQDDIASIASDFDFNHDGKRDIVVGGVSWDASASLKTTGGARIYFGRSAAPDTTQVLCTPDLEVHGFVTSDHMGSDVATLGDVDGDGCDEVAVAADSYESDVSLQNEGGVLVIFGAGSGCTAGPRYALLHSGVANAIAGKALAAADLDGQLVSGRTVSELVVTSAVLAQSGVTVGGLWVVRGDRLAALASATSTPYPVTAFADDQSKALIGPADGEQFGVAAAILPATATQSGVVLVGVASSGDNGTPRTGAVFGYSYTTALADAPLLRIGGEATPDGGFGDAVGARRADGGGARILVGAPASDGLSSDDLRVDDGAAYLFAVDSLK